jgi:hypothetical protein
LALKDENTPRPDEQMVNIHIPWQRYGVQYVNEVPAPVDRAAADGCC